MGNSILANRTGESLRNALRRASAFGCEVSNVRNTGEIRITHLAQPRKRVRVNGRRKDAPRSLLKFLATVEAMSK